MNPFRTFRFRFLGLAIGTASVASTAALGLTWELMRRQAIHQADRDLNATLTRALAEPTASEAIHSGSPPAPDSAAGQTASVALGALEIESHSPLFISSAWPDALPFQQLPAAFLTAAQSSSQERLIPLHGSEGRTRTASRPLYRTIRTSAGRWRLAAVATSQALLLGVQDLRTTTDNLGRLALSMILSLPLTLALAGASGVLLTRYTARRADGLVKSLERVTALGLSERVTEDSVPEEFRRLAQVFNTMMDRLEKGFRETRRFTADAAHELRTPLTVLQGKLEQRLQDSALSDDEKAFLADTMDELARLKAIIQQLLLLALTDARALRLKLEPLDLAVMAAELCDDLQILEPERAIRFELEGESWIQGDRGLLLQVLHNLLSNAQRYSIPGTPIICSVRSHSTTIRLSVTNSGRGISLDEREKIFDRFYRLEKSRSRAFGGAGLGLSLAREIARAHGGDLKLADGTPARTRFELKLPKASRPDSAAPAGEEPGSLSTAETVS